MKLYIPKQVSLITDAKEDEHVMDLMDWQDLESVRDRAKFIKQSQEFTQVHKASFPATGNS